MSIVFDILHLAVAALLAVIGVGYEREEECNPVRFQPAAEVESVEPEAQDPEVVAVSDCESGDRAVRFPAL